MLLFSSCASPIGRQNISVQPQLLLLGSDCLSFGTAVHELGHTIGFYHEHSRADRDKHVTVHESNIIPTNYSLNQFAIEDGDTLGFGYDYASIMHYPSRGFSKDGNETITPNRPNIFLSARTVDGIQELSPLDILKANTLYNCCKCIIINFTEHQFSTLYTDDNCSRLCLCTCSDDLS